MAKQFSKVIYKGVYLGQPKQRKDGLYQVQTKVNRSFFGPAWPNTDRGWKQAEQWFLASGHHPI